MRIVNMKFLTAVIFLSFLLVTVRAKDDAEEEESNNTRRKRTFEVFQSVSKPFLDPNVATERRIAVPPKIGHGQPPRFPPHYFDQGTPALTVRHVPRRQPGPKARPNKQGAPPYAVPMEPLVQYSQRDPLYHEGLRPSPNDPRAVKTEEQSFSLEDQVKKASTETGFEFQLPQISKREFVQGVLAPPPPPRPADVSPALTQPQPQLINLYSTANTDQHYAVAPVEYAPSHNYQPYDLTSNHIPQGPIYVTPQPYISDGTHPLVSYYQQDQHDKPYYIVKEPEPIIEIIVKESNQTLPPPPTPPTTPAPPPTKEPVHVFYVKYKKTDGKYGDPEGGKIQFDLPVPAVTPATKPVVTEPPVPLYTTPHPLFYDATPTPPTTTLRTIIRPDSETHHSSGGIHVSFGASDSGATDYKSPYARQGEEEEKEYEEEQSAPQPAFQPTAPPNPQAGVQQQQEQQLVPVAFQPIAFQPAVFNIAPAPGFQGPVGPTQQTFIPPFKPIPDDQPGHQDGGFPGFAGVNQENHAPQSRSSGIQGPTPLPPIRQEQPHNQQPQLTLRQQQSRQHPRFQQPSFQQGPPQQQPHPQHNRFNQHVQNGPPAQSIDQSQRNQFPPHRFRPPQGPFQNQQPQNQHQPPRNREIGHQQFPNQQLPPIPPQLSQQQIPQLQPVPPQQHHQKPPPQFHHHQQIGPPGPPRPHQPQIPPQRQQFQQQQHFSQPQFNQQQPNRQQPPHNPPQRQQQGNNRKPPQQFHQQPPQQHFPNQPPQQQFPQEHPQQQFSQQPSQQFSQQAPQQQFHRHPPQFSFPQSPQQPSFQQQSQQNPPRQPLNQQPQQNPPRQQLNQQPPQQHSHKQQQPTQQFFQPPPQPNQQVRQQQQQQQQQPIRNFQNQQTQQSSQQHPPPQQQQHPQQQPQQQPHPLRHLQKQSSQQPQKKPHQAQPQQKPQQQQQGQQQPLGGEIIKSVTVPSLEQHSQGFLSGGGFSQPVTPPTPSAINVQHTFNNGGPFQHLQQQSGNSAPFLPTALPPARNEITQSPQFFSTTVTKRPEPSRRPHVNPSQSQKQHTFHRQQTKPPVSTTAAPTTKAEASTTEDPNNNANFLKSLAALPAEVPDDIRQQLIASGILKNADIQILDYDKVGDIPIENLPPEALEGFLSQGSNPVPAIVRPGAASTTKKGAVEMKVVRYDPSKEQIERYVSKDTIETTRLDPVVLNDEKYNRYLPLKINGAMFPLPNVPELSGKNITSVVVLAPVDYNFQPNPDEERLARKVSERGAAVEVRDVKFVAGPVLKTLVRNPTKGNFQKWLETEKKTPTEKQSVILLVSDSAAKDVGKNKDIFMYDVATDKVSKLKGELSSAFVEVAESNAQSEDLDDLAVSSSEVTETRTEKPSGKVTITSGYSKTSSVTPVYPAV